MSNIKFNNDRGYSLFLSVPPTKWQNKGKGASVHVINTYADGGVFPLVPKFGTRWTWAASLPACFTLEKGHIAQRKDAAVFSRSDMYCERRDRTYEQSSITRFSPLKFAEGNHALNYTIRCTNTADENKILFHVSLTLCTIFELRLQNEMNSQNERKFLI
jgi:hypothetical protein